jgi:hypothetical protein
LIDAIRYGRRMGSVPYKFEFSTYYVSPYHRRARYFEEPIFPDSELRFTTLFTNLRNATMSMFNDEKFLRNVLNMPVKETLSMDNDLFCQAMSLQYISRDVYFDIYLILTPEGRSINCQLVKQSQLQLYSYFNFKLIFLRHSALFTPLSSRDFLFDLSQNNIKLKARSFNNSYIFAKLKNIIVFVCICLFLFYLN